MLIHAFMTSLWKNKPCWLILSSLFLFDCGRVHEPSVQQQQVEQQSSNAEQVCTPEAEKDELHNQACHTESIDHVDCKEETTCPDSPATVTICPEEQVVGLTHSRLKQQTRDILAQSLVVSQVIDTQFPSQVMFEHLGDKPICFVNALLGSAPHYYFLSVANHLLYASLHGYSYRSYRTNSLKPGFWDAQFPEARTSSHAWLYWEKFFAVQSMFDLRSSDDSREYLCEWVVWLDADMFFTKPTQSFQARLADYVPFDLLAPIDSVEGVEPVYGIFSREVIFPHIPINSGIFMLRRSDWADKLLEEMSLGYDDFKHESLYEQPQVTQFVLPEIRDDGYRSLLQQDWAKHTYLIPQRAINSRYIGTGPEYYPMPVEGYIWYEGDFLIHYAGRSSAVRYEEMIKQLEKIDFMTLAEQFVSSTSAPMKKDNFSALDLGLELKSFLAY